MKKSILIFLILFAAVSVINSLPAFPGAEGYGASATGGRGGKVLHVTNLKPDGPGSFSAACAQRGPRTVVFDTCGVITGDVTILHGDLTIAGETAPGGGITLNGRLWTEYETGIANIIVRFIRIRPTSLSGNQGDAIQFSLSKRFIFDHVSVCWGSDETIDAYEADSITVQWCTIEASANNAGHPDGASHNYGMINGPDGGPASVHHNLWAHHNHRTPAIANGPSDIRNNVVYNSTTGFVHHNPTNDKGFNFVGNYYRTGPTRQDINPWWFDDEDDPPGLYYFHDNYIDDPSDFTGVMEDPFTERDNYDGISWNGGAKATVPFTTPAVTTHSSLQAFDSVLSLAGCFPRDSITLKTVMEVRNRTGKWGPVVPAALYAGVIRSACLSDKDNDGMPDTWEAARGLDPDIEDHNGDDDKDGYTNLEEYLHYCAGEKSGLSSGTNIQTKKSPVRKQYSKTVKSAAYFTIMGRQISSLENKQGVVLKKISGSKIKTEICIKNK
jgi:hypothetical protein